MKLFSKSAKLIIASILACAMMMSTVTSYAATSPSWEIYYEVDPKYQNANPITPSIRNSKDIKGTFSNSATKLSNCYAFLRYWKNGARLNDYFDMQIYEYDYLHEVKNSSHNNNEYLCAVRFNNVDYNFTAYLLDNELIFDTDGQNYMKYFMLSGATFKLLIVERASYITPSTYLFEINSQGFQHLFNQIVISQ